MDFVDYVDRSVRLAEGLVNSHLPDGTHVHLETPRDLERLARAYRAPVEGRLTHRDLEEVEEVRARLRRVFEAGDPETAAGILNDLIAEAGARPQLVAHDDFAWHLHHVPLGATFARRIAGETAVALAVVVAQYGFERLRVCDWEGCGDVFVDRSRNRSRRYCSPAICGNRASAAAWRARQRARRGQATGGGAGTDGIDHGIPR